MRLPRPDVFPMRGRVEGMRPWLADIANSLIDDFAGKHRVDMTPWVVRIVVRRRPASADLVEVDVGALHAGGGELTIDLQPRRHGNCHRRLSR